MDIQFNPEHGVVGHRCYLWTCSPEDVAEMKIAGTRNFRCHVGHEHKLQGDEYGFIFTDAGGSSISTKLLCPTCLVTMLNQFSLEEITDGHAARP
jgi:hypothetical protein